jgi:hypothetical protein
MWHPTLKGNLDRRILVNYRLDPEVMARHLPAPFRPQIINGYGMGGICLIRMSGIGPKVLPFPVVSTTENGALRFAVEWDAEEGRRSGVYIPARYTTSRLAAWAGTRCFPGRHYVAKFRVHEADDRYEVSFDSPHLNMSVAARAVRTFTGSRVFSALDEASAFFQNGADGYSEALKRGTFDGVALKIMNWKVSPLEVERLSCDYFSDTDRYPAGSAEFDNALLMRGLRNEFVHLQSFCCMEPRREIVNAS